MRPMSLNYRNSYHSFAVLIATGHFPWLFESRLMKYLFHHSKGGKAVTYIKKVTLDLVRARRESGQADKV